jgi:hypothetical protein
VRTSAEGQNGTYYWHNYWLLFAYCQEVRIKVRWGFSLFFPPFLIGGFHTCNGLQEEQHEQGQGKWVVSTAFYGKEHFDYIKVCSYG